MGDTAVVGGGEKEAAGRRGRVRLKDSKRRTTFRFGE